MRTPALVVAALCLGVAPRASAQAPASAPDSSLLAPASLELGRKLFHGRGTCFACHGADLRGGPLCPPLNGTSWRHIDGTYAAILGRIENGLKGTLMPAHPGGINDQQAQQVAAYIYAVSHGLTTP